MKKSAVMLIGDRLPTPPYSQVVSRLCLSPPPASLPDRGVVQSDVESYSLMAQRTIDFLSLSEEQLCDSSLPLNVLLCWVMATCRGWLALSSSVLSLDWVLCSPDDLTGSSGSRFPVQPPQQNVEKDAGNRHLTEQWGVLCADAWNMPACSGRTSCSGASFINVAYAQKKAYATS